MYMGMAEVMELMRVRQPTSQRVFAFQEAILLRILSMIKLKALLSLLFVRIGTPRVLQSPMGRRWTFFGLGVLGIRQRRVEFKSEGIFLGVKTFLTKEQMEWPRVCQKRWEKMGWKPSGLGALKVDKGALEGKKRCQTFLGFGNTRHGLRPQVRVKDLCLDSKEKNGGRETMARSSERGMTTRPKGKF
nr:hypothetical protein CFP56_71982 [Quercus suber]